jgi:hypothetical protein
MSILAYTALVLVAVWAAAIKAEIGSPKLLIDIARDN